MPLRGAELLLPSEDRFRLNQRRDAGEQGPAEFVSPDGQSLPPGLGGSEPPLGPPRPQDANLRAEVLVGGSTAVQGPIVRTGEQGEPTAVRLHRYRRRATKPGLTAHEADLILPPSTSIVSREEFYEACRIAVEEAVKAKTSRRAQRLAERGAILVVMERYELVKITGGRRRAAPAASLSN